MGGLKGAAPDGRGSRFPDSDLIECPPTFKSRRFNECDIIGNFDRDEKGNVIVGEADATTGKYKDKDGRETNQRGYLLDANGNVINNLNGGIMFPKDSIDERGEIPAPIATEKYNFHPVLCRGDFDYDRNGKAMILKDAKGKYVDKRGNRVSQRGWRIDAKGNLID